MGSVDSQAAPDPTSSSTTFYDHCTWEEQNMGNELHSRVAALAQKHLTRTEAFAQLIRQIDGSMTDINEDHLQGKCPRDWTELKQILKTKKIGAGLTGADSEEEENEDISGKWYDLCYAQTLNGTDSAEEENEGISEDGSWPDMNHNLMDVVHDITAAIAQNNISDHGWAEIQQVIEAAANMCTANHQELDSEMCMEIIEYWEALGVMQLNTARTKVKFNEHAHDHLSNEKIASVPAIDTRKHG